jgi:outer membrane protein assembly factor BamB
MLITELQHDNARYKWLIKTGEGKFYAVNPDGTQKWNMEFTSHEAGIGRCNKEFYRN